MITLKWSLITWPRWSLINWQWVVPNLTINGGLWLLCQKLVSINLTIWSDNLTGCMISINLTKMWSLICINLKGRSLTRVHGLSQHINLGHIHFAGAWVWSACGALDIPIEEKENILWYRSSRCLLYMYVMPPSVVWSVGTASQFYVNICYNRQVSCTATADIPILYLLAKYYVWCDLVFGSIKCYSAVLYVHLNCSLQHVDLLILANGYSLTISLLKKKWMLGKVMVIFGSI